jgi:hypothetical protein
MIKVLSVPHHVTRLVFDAGQPYEKFCGRYEATVPARDIRCGEPAGRHIRQPADAPDGSGHGFFLYWRANMMPLLNPRPCTAYLMGSQVIAEKIRGADPAAVLDSLLRTMIYIDTGDRTRFAVDQPSTLFHGRADPAVAKLGAHLDRKLAELLDALGIDASQVLCVPALV